MTDSPILPPAAPSPSSFPPMHPVTRLGRTIQQLRSFGDLHANELEMMAQELEASGATDLAQRLRQYREVQRDESTMVVDELLDIQTDLAAAAQATQPGQPGGQPDQPSVPGTAPVAAASINPRDPAVNSPRRAKWLAEQAAEAERLRQPRSRRDLFGRVTPRPDENA
ncbi:MAG TPA: hypothetical protein VF937_14635 [Chloroflexota bacterium]